MVGLDDWKCWEIVGVESAMADLDWRAGIRLERLVGVAMMIDQVVVGLRVLKRRWNEMDLSINKSTRY